MSMISSKLNRRRLLLQIASASSMSLTAGLVGCSTSKDPDRAIHDRFIDRLTDRKFFVSEERQRITALPITHPERVEEFNRIWKRLAVDTKSVRISDKRFHIKADGKFSAGENVSEQNFLTRAAIETLRAGHEGFVIVHLDYDSSGLNFLKLVPDVNLSSRRWIGTYENYLKNRNEQNIFSSRKKAQKKGLDGVILMLDKAELPNRDRFSANEVYTNLIEYRANGYN